VKLVVRGGGREEAVEVARHGDRYRVTVGGRAYDVDAADLGAGMRSLVVGGRQHEVAVHPLAADGGGLDGRYRVSLGATRPAAEIEVLDPLTDLARQSHRAAAGGARAKVAALMPGRVVAVLAPAGTEVEPGQGVVVIEAMKMENEIAAEHSGVVKTVFVEEGQAVERGEPLFEIAPAGE